MADQRVKLECEQCSHVFYVTLDRLKLESQGPEFVVTCPKCSSADLRMFV